MEKNRTYNIVLCGLFTALIAVGAFLKIQVGMLPISMQCFFTMLAGLLLGKKWGALSCFVYMAMGLIGIPIFTQGGGIAYVLKPSFGYIVGFILGTYITGLIAYNKETPSFLRLFVANVIGLMAIYAVGIAYYCAISAFYLKMELEFRAVFMSCFVFVIPGDLVSAVVAAFIAKRLIPVMRKKRT